MALVSQRSLLQRRSLLTISLAIVCVIPVILVFLHISAKAQNAPWLDQWHPSVLYALKTVDGSLQFTDLFYQHNEHRIFFTNAVTVLLTVLTRWDIRLESYLSWLLAIANAGLLAALFRRLHPRSTLLIIPLFFLLTFSFRQSSGWLFGFMNCWYFLNLFFLLGIYILSQNKPGWKPLILAVGLGACAVFSSGAGLIVQGLLVVLMWGVGYRQKRYYAFWLLSTALILGIFFYHYHFNPRASAGLIPIVQYVLVMLGGQFIASPSPQGTPLSVTIGTVFGLTGLLLLGINTLIALARRQSLNVIVIWLVIAALPIASAFIAAPNRVNFSPTEPLQSKNVILTHLFWVAVVISSYSVWVSWNAGAARWRKFYRNALVAIFLLLAPFYLWSSYADTQLVPPITEPEFQCYLRYPSTRDKTCLDGEYFLGGEPSSILEKIDHLAVHRLTAFAYVDDSLIPDALASDYFHIRYDPENPIFSPYVYLAEHYALQGEVDRAIVSYDMALSISPSYTAYMSRAALYTSLQEYDQALADYASALEINPGYEGTYAARAEIYIRLGDYENAVRDFTSAISIMPGNSWLWTKRGTLYSGLGSSEQARLDLEQALALDPSNVDAQQALTTLNAAASDE